MKCVECGAKDLELTRDAQPMDFGLDYDVIVVDALCYKCKCGAEYVGVTSLDSIAKAVMQCLREKAVLTEKERAALEKYGDGL